jgi:alkylated DNA repair dioxygenase AlkB
MGKVRWIHCRMMTRPWHWYGGWLPEADCRHWQRLLSERLLWQQPVVRVYGREHPVPRLTFYLADPGLAYRYSGVVHRGEGWPDWFKPLLTRVRAAADTPFNGCLLNLYRHGNDRMGWHADDEPEIAADQAIASLSLGASRTFQFRHRQTRERHDLELGDGDLLVMAPGCQQVWLHAVPVRKKVISARINLTFRVFHPPAGLNPATATRSAEPTTRAAR